MNDDLLRFTVTRLSATVPEGVLDYASRRARAEFHVRLSFPQFAEVLGDLGVDPALSKPVHAVLRSEGDILDDHGFALSGTCDLEPHDLLPREVTRAAVLPGQ